LISLGGCDWMTFEFGGTSGMHGPLQAQRSRTLAGLAQSGVWILVGLVPIIFLLRSFALTLYSVPESDDFCFSYMNRENGFAETIWIFYRSLVGRIVPLAVIQLPATISGATGFDYFICYVVTLAGLEICFAAAILVFAFRMWPRGSVLQNIAFGAAFAATMLGAAPSLRELLYWLPGVACYTLPGVIVALVLGEFVRAAESGTRITPVTTSMLALGCLVASLCNEFTPPWLIGLVLCSLAVRRIFQSDLQIREHAVIGGATLLGFLIMLLAPANAVRMAQFPMAGNVGHSLWEAFLYSLPNLMHFFAEPTTGPWLVFVILYTAAQPQPANVSAWNRRFLAALVPIFCLACGYLAYFTHQYATDIRLSTRAQNEVVILLVSGLTVSATLLARTFYDPIHHLIEGLMPGQRGSFAVAAIPIALCAILILPLYFSKTSTLLRSEQGSFHTFWLESMMRHARLTLSMETDLVVASHTVFPTALMGGDMTDDPSRLPNDCIARFYEKNAVVASPAVTR
jgi:hypothetical protein